MLVCAHGDVADFCKDRDMLICEEYDGDIERYSGSCRVLVTDRDMSENEYYFLKGKLLGRGVELVSTRYKDNRLVAEFLSYQADRRKKNYGGRHPFGCVMKDGVAVPTAEGSVVVRRILELRDAGHTLRQIQTDEGVHHPDGRQISISTLQQIIKNRARYE